MRELLSQRAFPSILMQAFIPEMYTHIYDESYITGAQDRSVLIVIISYHETSWLVYNRSLSSIMVWMLYICDSLCTKPKVKVKSVKIILRMCVCGKTFPYALPCTGFHCVWLPLAQASMEMAKWEVFIWPTLGISDTYLYTYTLHIHLCALALVGSISVTRGVFMFLGFNKCDWYLHSHQHRIYRYSIKIQPRRGQTEQMDDSK